MVPSSDETYEWDGGLCPKCKTNHMTMTLRKDGWGSCIFRCPCGHTRPQNNNDSIPAGWWVD